MKKHRSHQYPTTALEEAPVAAARISPLLALIALTLVAAGCSAGMEAPTSESPAPVVADSSAADTSFLLPDHPPDYSPPDLRAELDSVWLAPVDILGVGFQPGLSRERKTELVVEAGGVELVGGNPMPPIVSVDGVYLIRFRTDGTMGPLLRARDLLNASPDVFRAFPLITVGAHADPTLATLSSAAANASATAAGVADSILPFLLPEHPPDSIPADAWQDDPYWRAPLDVFAVTFRTGLTREEKTRLVVDVGAIDLVGGAPFADDTWYDGIYLIRIHDDGTMTPLRKAIDALNDDPDVIAAFMLTTMG